MDRTPFQFGPLSGNQTGFVVRIPKGISDRGGLFDAMERERLLPPYFGSNWDALEEVLRDFHWIPQRRIIIIHEDLPRLPERELQTYLDVLRNCVGDWTPDDDHELIAVFPEESRDRIESLLEID